MLILTEKKIKYINSKSNLIDYIQMYFKSRGVDLELSECELDIELVIDIDNYEEPFTDEFVDFVAQYPEMTPTGRKLRTDLQEAFNKFETIKDKETLFYLTSEYIRSMALTNKSEYIKGLGRYLNEYKENI